MGKEGGIMGCPCCNDCCDKPNIVNYDHVCNPDEDEFCEECYGLTCLNCNDTCFCQV